MRARAVGWSAAVGLVLAVALLLAPPMGTDLSAQVARADFFAGYGWTPLDLRWYGGTVQYGYSWTSPAVMALLGPPLTGAVALVASSVAFAWLLVRSRVPRPLLGGVLGAGCFAGNLVSGRVTFALGVAVGLWALVALVGPPARWRLPLAGAGALIAAATSPVVGLFVGLVGAALLVDRSRRDGLVLGVGAGLPLVLNGLWFGDGGIMNIGRTDMTRAVVTGLVVALLVPYRAVRVGALLSSAGVLAAFVVPTPVGLNATRLATIFGLPVLAAAAAPAALDLGRRIRARSPGRRLDRVPTAAWLVPLLVGLALWQQPVMDEDLRDAGNPTAAPGYFAPLVTELRSRGPVGRVEIPPTRDYWEAAHVADAVPLARGWLRQVDLARNGFFFEPGPLDPDTYERWLRDNGVTYVALPDADFSWIARSEVALLRAGVPYLREVWRSAHWTLYEVTGRPSIVDGARLVAATGDAVVFDAPAAGDVLVRVRWSRWLKVNGAATLSEGPNGWTTVHVPRSARFTLTS